MSRKEYGLRRSALLGIAALLLLTLAGAVPVLAGDGVFDISPLSHGLQREAGLLGSATANTWPARTMADKLPFLAQEIGGSSGSGEFGVVEEDEGDDSGPSNLGAKVKAGALSAVLPGAGQFYNGQQKKAFIMVGAEVAIWGAYLVFDHQGDNRMESAREYAGFYAGTSGDHNDDYWQAVGGYMDSDSYNDDLLREARALQEEATGLIDGEDAWQWVNEERQGDYQKIRADGNSAYDRRDFMILFAVVNRAISVVDAVLGAGMTHENKPGTLQTQVLGMDVEMGLAPSWRDPGARCVVSRRF